MADYDIGAAFSAIEKEIINSMMRNMKRHKVEEVKEKKEWAMWQAKQLEALERFKKKNKRRYNKSFRNINETVDELIRQATEEGGLEQEIELLKRINKQYGNNLPAVLRRAKEAITSRLPFGSKTKLDFFQVNDKKVHALMKATKNDMRKAESAMLRMSNDQYRKIIFNAQMYAATGAGTYEQAVDMATKDFMSAGINCIEYKDGRRVNIKDYADMVLKTSVKRAGLYTDGEVRKELGLHLVISKKRTNACPKCLPFVGKIMIDDVWSGGTSEDGEYPLLSDAMAAGFLHPRCKDSITTYIPGITEPPDDSFTQEELEEIKEKSKKEAKKQHAKQQEEKFKRLSDNALDPENKKQYENKAKQWRNASETKE